MAPVRLEEFLGGLGLRLHGRRGAIGPELDGEGSVGGFGLGGARHENQRAGKHGGKQAAGGVFHGGGGGLWGSGGRSLQAWTFDAA
jgi:hypothetical protein